MPKHEDYRQGVVYGPQRSYGGRDLGSIMGSLLGLLVVAGTVGLLGFGVIFFLQQNDGAASPSPPNAAAASPGGSGGLSGQGASSNPTSPTPALTPTPLPTPTPVPTIFVPDVQEGPGFVTFGSEADLQLHVKNPRTTFTVDERMVWSAYLPGPEDSVNLEIRVLKLDPVAPDGQRLVRTDQVKPKAKNTERFLRQVRIKRVLDGPGLYTVEYVRDNNVLAIGSFLVVTVEPSASPSATPT